MTILECVLESKVKVFFNYFTSKQEWTVTRPVLPEGLGQKAVKSFRRWTTLGLTVRGHVKQKKKRGTPTRRKPSEGAKPAPARSARDGKAEKGRRGKKMWGVGEASPDLHHSRQCPQGQLAGPTRGRIQRHGRRAGDGQMARTSAQGACAASPLARGLCVSLPLAAPVLRTYTCPCHFRPTSRLRCWAGVCHCVRITALAAPPLPILPRSLRTVAGGRHFQGSGGERHRSIGVCDL